MSRGACCQIPAVSKVNSPFLQLNMTLFSKCFVDLKAHVIFPRLWGTEMKCRSVSEWVVSEDQRRIVTCERAHSQWERRTSGFSDSWPAALPNTSSVSEWYPSLGEELKVLVESFSLSNERMNCILLRQDRDSVDTPGFYLI